MNPETAETSQSTISTSPMPARPVIVLVCGLLATWLAAGSLGWIAPPLQKTLTWLALGTVVMLAFGARSSVVRSSGRVGFWVEHGRWLLVAAAAIAALMNASPLAVVNILAVAVLLATAALVRPGMFARVAGPAALAAATLGIFRLIAENTNAGWFLTDTFGRAEGHWAALLTGRPLSIGASFGGVDFLVVMTALAAAWHRTAPQPSIKRAVVAALAIAAAQTVYLVVLAFSHDLTAMLPASAQVITTDVAHMGVWSWSNAVRAMLPWRLPLVAAIFQTTVAVLMFRLVSWPTSPQDAEVATGGEVSEVKRRDRRERRIMGNPAETVATVRALPTWLRLAPAALLLIAAAAIGIAPVKPDLAGRRIVAYDDGTIDWSTTDPGNGAPGLVPRYGLLPALVSSLGGQFVVSKDLKADDLRDANVLIVLPPGANRAGNREEFRERIWNFVNGGGGLIVAGQPETRPGTSDNALNELLKPTAMSFRDDTANSLTDRWECNLTGPAHAATATSRPGRTGFSVDRAASVRVSWEAWPLLVGRWCWNELGSDPIRGEALSYSPGNRLGDLVLAAQQKVGQGSVVVLGDASCLSNDGIPFSYTFCGPLLAALAEKGAAPLAWWRQYLAVITAAVAVVLLFHRFEPLRLVVASIAVSLAAIACNHLNDATPQLLPSAAKSAQRPVIYVDGSHLEAMGKDPWRDDGIGRFMRVLAESNYLPLLAPDLDAARMKKAKMLVSIAPGRQFTEGERVAIDEFVNGGGVFLSMAGSPDAGPSKPLLEKLGLQIPPMPLPPWQNERETEPLGAMTHGFIVPPAVANLPSGPDQYVRFFSAWPVASSEGGNIWPDDDARQRPVIVGNRFGTGQVFLLGDSNFALQKSFVVPPELEEFPPQNAAFWQTTLRSWLGAEK